jgi:uncharacterized protein with von Willebrand factor type A (vWA) domain
MTLTANLVVFGRLLRSAGMAVPTSGLVTAVDALMRVGLARRGDVYHALRTVLVVRRDDLPLFDAAFAAFWQDHGERWGRRDLRAIGEPRSAVSLQIETVLPELDASPGDGDEGDAAADLPAGELRTWSGAEALRDQDFADMTPSELAAARQALDALAWHPGERRTRRWVPGAGPRIDLRRAWRRSLQTGELLVLPRRARAIRRRPLVVFCDVSGSMERYARMLLHFAHALTRTHHQVEAFTFSTRLTRITRELGARRVNDALGAAARRVPDWSGGTRIGDALRVFHVQWARYVLKRSAVVLVISDGWDRGEPGALAREVARLQRSCHRLIWLSPLLGTADYEPLTRGLVAALPFVDDFLPARTLGNLEDLARHLNTLPARRQSRRHAAPPHGRLTS